MLHKTVYQTVYLSMFKDPRNLAGYLADFMKLAMPAIQLDKTLSSESFAVIRTVYDLTCSFAHAPRTIIGGYKRPLHYKLAGQIENIREQMVSNPLNNPILSPICSAELRSFIYDVITAIWSGVKNGYSIRRREDTERDVIKRYKLNGEEIAKIEMHWIFKDATNRKHHGKEVREAFEAAWLTGNHDFARALVTNR